MNLEVKKKIYIVPIDYNKKIQNYCLSVLFIKKINLNHAKNTKSNLKTFLNPVKNLPLYSNRKVHKSLGIEKSAHIQG